MNNRQVLSPLKIPGCSRTQRAKVDQSEICQERLFTASLAEGPSK
jgi:hypothetical protein